MSKVDIADQTKKVGNALGSVSVEKMILDMAKGIAWGQFELDQVGVKVTKMMGAPGSVSIGGENLSMLEAGFIPSFYHFVDTILELKMEVKIREEEIDTSKLSETTKNSTSTDYGGSVEAKGKFLGFSTTVKADYRKKTTNAYSKTVDATHSQQFSQELNASSLMRTKLVPKPAPEMLVERIKILVDKLREDASDKAKNTAPEGVAPEEIANQEQKLLMDSIGKDLLEIEPESAPEPPPVAPGS